MSRSAPLCEYHDHTGPRLVDRRDLWEQRVEFRSVLTQNTGPRITIRHICTACMKVEAEVARRWSRRAPVTSEVLW